MLSSIEIHYFMKRLKRSRLLFIRMLTLKKYYDSLAITLIFGLVQFSDIEMREEFYILCI